MTSLSLRAPFCARPLPLRRPRAAEPVGWLGGRGDALLQPADRTSLPSRIEDSGERS